MAVKTNHVCGDDIEFVIEIWQRLECLDPPDLAFHVKQLNHFLETRFFVEVQAENIMSKVLADVEEVSGAATDVENPPASPQIETEVSDSLQINFHPQVEVEVFRPR